MDFFKYYSVFRRSILLKSKSRACKKFENGPNIEEDSVSGLKEFHMRTMKLLTKFQKRLWKFVKNQA